MKQTAWRIAQVLAALQLFKAIELHGVYTNLRSWLSTDQVMSLLNWALSFAGILFVLLPIAAVIGLFRYRRWGFIPLIVFPLIAIVFGAIPIPFVSYLYSSDVQFMGKVTVGINVIFSGIGLALFWYSRSKTEVVE